MKTEKQNKKDRQMSPLLSQFLKGVPEAMVIVDGEGVLQLVNDSFCAMSGYHSEELVGKSLSMLVPDRFQTHHTILMASFWQQEKGNIQVHKKVRLVSKNGIELPVDIRLRMLHLKDECFVCATIRDVSEERKAAMLLEQDFAMQQVVTDVLKLSLESSELERQLDKILKRLLSMPQLAQLAKGCIYTIDDEKGGFSLRSLAGFEEGGGRPCDRIFLGNGYCGKALKEGRLVYGQCEDQDGTASCTLSHKHGHYCVPIKRGRKRLGLINLFLMEGHQQDPAEERSLSMIADALAWVIGHHQAEKEKWNLQRKLGESSRLAMLGRLAARFAHEIRNPLTAVGGFARRLQKNTLPDEKSREYVSLMVSEVERLENVLRNLLTMSQPQLDATHPHDVNEIVEYLVNGFSEECREKHITLRSSLHELPLVPMNSRLVREAIENIISNAVDAMPEGGLLTVSSEPYIRHNKQYALVIVKDTGEGIAPERLSLIYEPFYTSKSANRRIGLGLASTKKIVEDHNGFINISSEVGKGTSVQLAFSTSQAPKAKGIVNEAVVEQPEEGYEASDRDLNILRAAVDSANEAFVTIDVESRIIFINEAAERLFRVNRQEVLGKDISLLIGEELDTQHKKAMTAFLERGKAKSISLEQEMDIHTADGSRLPLSISFSVAENRGKIYCTGIIRDLREFKVLQDKIINAERLAALGQTVAEISHEIKNPLIAIGGLAVQLQKQSTDEKALAKLKVIIYEVARLEDLLSGLRDLYMPWRLESTTFDITELLREIRDQLSVDLEKRNVQFIFVAEMGGTEVHADRQRIKQVLLNVLQNGLEAMEDGGILSLRVISSPTTVEIVVKDSGSGIASATLTRVFDPFFTTKQQGTGLGLCISKRIVEEHQGGTFGLKSEIGMGTEVKISLPRQGAGGSNLSRGS